MNGVKETPVMEKLKDDEAAQIGKALGDPNRLAIYSDLARHNELVCNEMHCNHPISGPTLSHHLKVLTDLGLITYRKEGLNMFYRVVPEKFAAYLSYLAEIGPKTSSSAKPKPEGAKRRTQGKPNPTKA
jgi:ArsR family transcriptional regulator